MSARDLLDRADIVEIWTALGGARLRRNRGSAFWRDSKSRSVSLSPDKNAFYDHKPGTGGGVLRLIEVAFGCDREAAWAWLAQHLGVTFDRHPLTRAEKRRYAQRSERAEAVAADVTKWRRREVDGLRAKRNRLYKSEAAACRIARGILAGEARDTEGRWAVVWAHALDDQLAVELDRKVGQLDEATPSEVLAKWREHRARKLVA